VKETSEGERGKNRAGERKSKSVQQRRKKEE